MSYRRLLGGTVAKAGSRLHDKRGSGGGLSDLGRHNLVVDGDKLESPFFPIVYPKFNINEANERDACVKSPYCSFRTVRSFENTRLKCDSREPLLTF
jgi:hypothetical protein